MSDESASVLALRSAISARDDFVATVLHELRNPMTPIVLQVELLRELVRVPGAASPQVIDGLDRLGRAVSGYKRRAETLLDASRLLAGAVPLPQPASFDVAALVAELLRAWQPVATSAGCRIEAELPARLVGCWDPLWVEQIVDNMVSNALKFGAHRPITVRLDRTDGEMRLAVRDHGIGIAPEDQIRIFERFERVVQHQGQPGFGVGLWVAMHLARGMDGRIMLESEPGAGACFTLALPLRHEGVCTIDGQACRCAEA